MQTFGLFVKHPVPGRVKTRLAAQIGAEPACRLYTAFLADLTDRCRAVSAQRYLGFSPDDAATRAYFQSLAGDEYQLWPQPSSDLGRRMFAFFSDHLQHSGDQAVLIGSDSPNLPIRFIADAFEHLRHADIVLGPAADGGYYLVGMNHPAKDIFQDIAWSQPTVLCRTVELIRQQRLSLALLPLWYDVDSQENLQMLHGHLAALELAGIAHDCLLTRSVLHSLQGSDVPGSASNLPAQRLPGT